MFRVDSWILSQKYADFVVISSCLYVSRNEVNISLCTVSRDCLHRRSARRSWRFASDNPSLANGSNSTRKPQFLATRISYTSLSVVPSFHARLESIAWPLLGWMSVAFCRHVQTNSSFSFILLRLAESQFAHGIDRAYAVRPKTGRIILLILVPTLLMHLSRNTSSIWHVRSVTFHDSNSTLTMYVCFRADRFRPPCVILAVNDPLS